mmetsp:Transcript_27016/g.27255  ORF Transcript_27016/g.27255 Transcript_27016/m.27255 type:complete len:351 (+) Transcript_27016:110-1162(+)|eukprot:CAMPEP_0182421434 /NCGR_PEP_ID=MMETSP1167-20130531/6835_1 /TAXON_ID=2988 /ORGANISM="Mallomonas Sp, Strain CCMP3275" /LENGTH=350 /DNA_ID=CAMNT_0024598585 /DNA_START=72 /DNA_END=1124 /DNA_ORIENTATION=-
MDKISLIRDVVPFCSVVVLTVAWIFSSRPNENIKAKTLLRKLNMYMEGFFFMVLSKDSKGLGPKKNPDPDEILGTQTTIKRIIFIRHGESEWNDIFNKGKDIGMLVRFLKAWYKEITFLFSMDSVFLDSQLNLEGTTQAKELGNYLESTEDSKLSEKERDIIKILRGESETSVIVSSNLRRAISTTTIALWPRIERTGEKIVILSSLQEVSRNVDTKTVTGYRTVPNLSRLADVLDKFGKPFLSENVFEVSENHGNKKSSFYGIKRLKAFNEWVFKRNEDNIIVGGHSLWFKYFFQTFMPFKSNHVAKTQKIANSGIVSFNLHRVELGDGPRYRIDPESIVVIYGGFTKK